MLNGMFFNGMLAFVDKTYIILAVTSLLTVRLTLRGLLAQSLDFAFASFGLLIVALYPLAIVLIFIYGRDSFLKKKYWRRFGYAYSHLKYRTQGMKSMV